MVSYWSCPMERLGVLAAGGMNVYVINLANELGKLGHRVDIFTRIHKARHADILVINKNVRVIHLESSGDSQDRYTGNFTGQIIDFVQRSKEDYDIIHAHYYLSGWVGKNLKTVLDRPLLTTFHTLGYLKEKYTRISDRERLTLESEVIEASDCIISSTEIEKLDLITLYKAPKDKIIVVPPGVNHRIFKKHDKLKSRKKLKIPLNKKIILFVGRIDPVKGLVFLLQAIYELTGKHPEFMNNFRVLLIGGDISSRNFWENKEVGKIKKMIYNLKIDCCVKFLGSKPHNQLAYYYSAADTVVMPSVYESFGLVVLEALASGASVIASSAGGLKLLIRDGYNGRLFEPGNPSSLGKVLMETLKNRYKMDKMKENAVVSSQKYCWHKQAVRIANIYKLYI